MEMSKKRRAIELLKDALILVLSCSAVWLAFRTPLSAPMRELFREEGAQAAPGAGQGDSRGTGALPMAMVVNVPGSEQVPEGAEGTRCGLQYDQAACQELFRRVAGPLVETLSSAGAPERISRRQWEETLTSGLGVYLDFQGEIPLSVLVGWLSGEEIHLEAPVRRMALTMWEGGLDVSYRDEGSGSYYRCRSQVAGSFSLAEALSGLTDNGAFFAFESSLYQDLDPDTLFLPDAPAPAVYTSSDPVNGGQGALEALVRDLGFSLNSTSFYSTDEQVARSGDDSVRLSDRGVAQYEGGNLFPVLRQGGAGELFDRVETCRQLALSALGPRCGEARLYLTSVEETPEGWEISFGYSLNGIPVLTEPGYAARFLVREGRIDQFSLYLRSYTASEDSCLVLPPRQGAAALAAQGLGGEELLLTYTDSGGDTLTAGWSARENWEG